MTSSRSIISRSSWLVVVLVAWASVASAGGRKRIVVLDFEGPKAQKFHDDLVRIIKKSHTVVTTEKWNGAAEELDAGKVTEKNVKKVAKKLKIDGIVTGKIEKRRDEYILRLKLRSGTSGEITGNSIETKAEGPRIDGKASRDIKDELIAAIDELEANHGGGGGDDDEDKPAKKKASDDDDADKPAKKKGAKSDDDDEPADKPAKHGGFSKKDDDAKGGDKIGGKKKKGAKPDDDDADKPAKKVAKKDDDEDKPAKKKKDDDTAAVLSTKHDDDETPLPKASKKTKADDAGDDDAPKKKRVAKADDGDDGTSAEVDVVAPVAAADALSPSQRAIDATVGLSFTARRLGFSYASTLQGNQVPPGYKQSVPVAGAMLDLTVYPLSFNHDRHDILAGVGVNVMYDRVIKINSQKSYVDPTSNTTMVANLQTAEDRFQFGGVFRYPLGKGASAAVVGGTLSYMHQQFGIQQSLPNGSATDVPNVSYSILRPAGFIKYPLSSQLVLDADVGLLAVLGTGDIGTPQQYGKASTLGFDFEVGGDYMLSKNLFIRATGRVETIGLTFAADPTTKANNRGGDTTMQTVFGARDTYFGGVATIGYAY